MGVVIRTWGKNYDLDRSKVKINKIKKKKTVIETKKNISVRTPEKLYFIRLGINQISL